MVENRNLMTTVVLVLSGMAYNVTSGPPATPGSAASGAAAAGTGTTKAGSHGADDSAPDRTFQAFAQLYQNHRVKFLISLVPDPVDTHLAIFFDRAIESVQNAASTSGYTFDRYWIPWRENTYAATADPTVRGRQEDEKRTRESQPGLMLFRGEPAKQDLAVFLVGETPTAGINTSQFGAAVKFIWEVACKEQKKQKDCLAKRDLSEAPTIPVSGPSFSGSLASLQAAIALTGSSNFRVISGSTTSAKAQNTFQLAVPNFYSTVHDDVYARCQFLSEIGAKSRWPDEDPVKVAFLSEGDTAFGSDFRATGSAKNRGKKRKNQKDHTKGENGHAETETGAADPPDANPSGGLGVPASQICPGLGGTLANPLENSGADVRVFELPFPRDIARLRNAYHEDSQTDPLPKAYKAATPEGVPLTLKDPNIGHDNVPSFSHEHTPLSQETVLQNLATALRSNEVQYVGILATDPLDTFFLARFLATNTPGIRLFQFDADLLFVHSPENLPLDGMLSVTTYPLFSQNQQWTDPQVPWRIFSSRYSQGFYNANLALLREDPAVRAPKQAAGNAFSVPALDAEGERGTPLLGFHSPFEKAANSVPPLWLTATGRNAYWPIALLDRSADKDSERNPVSPEAIQEPGHLVLLLLLALAMVAVGGAAALWRAGSSNAPFFAEFKLQPDWFSPSAAGPEPWNRAFYLLVCVLSLFAIYLCLAGPLWILFHPAKGAIIESNAAVAPVLVFAGCVIYLLLRAWKNQPVRAFLATGIFGGFVLGWVILLVSGERHEGFFLAYRSLNLVSGLAPNVPLMVLFLALAVWGRMHWRRRILIEERNQAAVEIAGTKFKRSAAEIGEAIDEASFDGALVAGAVAVWGFTWFVCFTHLQTLEHRSYDWVYSCGVALLSSLLFLTTVRFVTIWRMLERFLEEVELHPIRFALSDLPPDRTWSPIWQSNVSKRSHILLARGVDCLRAMDPNDPNLEELTQKKQLVIERVAIGESESHYQIEAMQVSVQIAQRLAGDLSKDYWMWGSWENSVVGKRRQNRQYELAAEFISLRFLAYIRYVMLHLSNLLGFLISGFILGLISLHSYPFQSPQIIGTFSLAIFGALAGAVVWVFLRMSNNPALKRISSAEGKGDWNVWLKLAEAGVLPLLAVVSSSIPGAGQFLFSWLGPVLDKLH